MTYTYYCDTCKIEYSREESMLAKHAYVCPNCNVLARRKFSVPAVAILGTHYVGQHRNDGISSGNVVELNKRT